MIIESMSLNASHSNASAEAYALQSSSARLKAYSTEHVQTLFGLQCNKQQSYTLDSAAYSALEDSLAVHDQLQENLRKERNYHIDFHDKCMEVHLLQ